MLEIRKKKQKTKSISKSQKQQINNIKNLNTKYLNDIIGYQKEYAVINKEMNETKLVLQKLHQKHQQLITSPISLCNILLFNNLENININIAKNLYASLHKRINMNCNNLIPLSINKKWKRC